MILIHKLDNHVDLGEMQEWIKRFESPIFAELENSTLILTIPDDVTTNIVFHVGITVGNMEMHCTH